MLLIIPGIRIYGGRAVLSICWGLETGDVLLIFILGILVGIFFQVIIHEIGNRVLERFQDTGSCLFR